MAINRIEFGGQVLPCYIERYPAIKKAARKFRQYSIPGRNGDIFFQDDAYENVIQPYQVYCGDDHYGAQMDWGELAKYLYLDGYQKLQDTYDPEHFRKAVFNGPLDVENSWNTHGRATLEFNCRPERYRVDGATPIAIPAATYELDELLVSDLGASLKSSIETLCPDAETMYMFSVPSTLQDKTVTFNWRNDGLAKWFWTIDPGTETSPTGMSTWGTKKNSVNIGTPAKDVLIPSVYYDEEPVIQVDDVTIGSPYILRNHYMPSYPDIILHNVASYSGEKMVFQVNSKTVYIEYDASMPYYFIDTENSSVTCSDTLTGEQVLANNVYISSDFRLQSGDNYIFTTQYYDAIITPNWWEL